ncbi:MAG: sensor histidine kinase [bacterium]|nr:sensor histidine kinase [bacterium]
MAAETKFDLQTVLDGLGQGVLIFNREGRLVLNNLAARQALGADFNLIRDKGWDAASTLFNTRQTNPDETIEAVRDRALQSSRPVRFHLYRSGEYIPCWAAAVLSEGGEVCTMITLDAMDWSAMTNLLDRFRNEMQEAIQSTQGHIDLINQTIKHAKPDAGAEVLAKRIGGFTRLISVHMYRIGRLMEMSDRLENIRTGNVREVVRQRRRKIVLVDFLEDFAEKLDEIMLVDPETEAQDHRSRLVVDIPKGLAISASSTYLTRILQDMLRNAIMYSMKATPVKIVAREKGQNVQIDMIDEGYGIREKERERVFEAFQRARQPQIVAEFGYGLSLYLCKHEVEAMNGRLWFESEEGVGTTFSMMLPLYREDSAASSDRSS